jgi:hypothetical protein
VCAEPYTVRFRSLPDSLGSLLAHAHPSHELQLHGLKAQCVDTGDACHAGAVRRTMRDPCCSEPQQESPVDLVLVKDTRHIKQKSLALAALGADHVNAIIVVSLCVLHQGLHAHLPPAAADGTRVRANMRVFFCYAIDRYRIVETGKH